MTSMMIGIYQYLYNWFVASMCFEGYGFPPIEYSLYCNIFAVF